MEVKDQTVEIHHFLVSVRTVWAVAAILFFFRPLLEHFHPFKFREDKYSNSHDFGLREEAGVPGNCACTDLPMHAQVEQEKTQQIHQTLYLLFYVFAKLKHT